MTNDPSLPTLLRRAADLVGDDLAPPTAAGFAATRTRRRRTLAGAVAAVVIVAAVATGVGVLGHRDTRGQPVASPSPTALWRPYSSSVFDFRVDHPASWFVTPGGIPTPAGVGTVVELATVRIGPSCTPLADGATRCGDGPHAPLRPGDVLVTWTWNGGPLGRTAEQTIRDEGTVTTIGGRPAWIRIRPSHTATCEGRTVAVLLVAGGERFTMTACLAGSGRTLDRLQADVLRSARSARVGG